MLFSEVLALHEQFHHEGCLDGILGDGFLIKSNPIYRKVRFTSEQIGCSYVEAYPEYLLMPFQELPNIIAGKKIPYVPTGRLIKGIEATRPNVFSSEDMALPESYHMHEAAHVIAEEVLKAVRPGTPQEQILKAILAESFANSVDALTCAYVAEDVHDFFIKQNCYMHPREEVVQAMNAIISAAGFRFAFMLTFFVYVRANFLTSKLANNDIRDLAARYAPNFKIGASLKKELKTVCAIGEILDPLFRVTTTGNYFKQLGFEEDIRVLLDFDYTDILDQRPGFSRAIERLCDVLA